MNIDLNKTALGIELGSTRIKAVLINENHEVLANGSYEWENQYIDGFWTYNENDIWLGLRECYKNLKNNYFEKYNQIITKIGSIGISAMMHGYIVLDDKNKLLTNFRTWRNNNTEKDALELTSILNNQIPARWSIAHLYYAINQKEPYLDKINYQTTLAGYVHYMLTNQKVLGINDASGMFPIDINTHTYDEKAVSVFNDIIKKEGLNFRLEEIFPKVLTAGMEAGNLSKKGALLLDPTGDLKIGIPLAPPEGDAGTGMISTNTIKVNTGNISAGTSIFGMFVIDKKLSKIYPEVDIVTTPDGNLVSMIHVNNCTSDINMWINLFKEINSLFDNKIDDKTLYDRLFKKALEGDQDAGNMALINYISGENITKIERGMPLFLRTVDSNFNLANFMRLQIYSAFATLKIGMNILTKNENISMENVLAHGGIFTTKNVAQRFLSAALELPVSVNDTANEGGPYGMAILAMYLLNKNNLSLNKYLDKLFKNNKVLTIKPSKEEVEGFNKFLSNYNKALELVKIANEIL